MARIPATIAATVCGHRLNNTYNHRLKFLNFDCMSDKERERNSLTSNDLKLNKFVNITINKTTTPRMKIEPTGKKKDAVQYCLDISGPIK